jgi:cytoskeletal protein RodZ
MADMADENIVNTAELLRNERQRLQLSIDSVAKDICVGRCYLMAIEEGDFSRLPELTFAIGFVRAFAKSLKLDAHKVAADFKGEYLAYLGMKPEVIDPIIGQKCSVDSNSVSHSSSTDFNMTSVTSPSGRGWPTWLAPVVGLAGASMIWVFLGTGMSSVSMTASQSSKELETEKLATVQAMFVDWDEKEPARNTNVTEIQKQLTSFDGQAAATKSLFLPAAKATIDDNVAEASSPVVLHALEDSWVQLSYGDGTEMWSGVLHEGQSFQPRLIGDVFLSTTNAGGVSVERNSIFSGPLGARGVFVKELPLTNKDFADTSIN